MAGRLYMIPYTGTVTNAGGNADLLEVAPAANKICRIRGIMLGQISEVADAAEEGLQLSFVRMTATVTGSNGSAVTPVPVRSAIANTAAGAAVEANGATVATTSGTATVMGYLGWNIRNSPWDMFFPDERFCPEVQNAEFIFLRQDTTAADDYTGCFTFWLEED